MTTQTAPASPKFFIGCAAIPPYHVVLVIEPLKITDDDILALMPKIEKDLIVWAQQARWIADVPLTGVRP